MRKSQRTWEYEQEDFSLRDLVLTKPTAAEEKKEVFGSLAQIAANVVIHNYHMMCKKDPVVYEIVCRELGWKE